MLELLREMSRTAQATSERALRMVVDVLVFARERLQATGEPPAPYPDSQAGWQPVDETRFGEPAATCAPPAESAAARQSAAAGQTASDEEEAKLRADQLLRVLELLSGANGRWLSAKELSDAGEKASTPILPGNVRKVIRSRGDGLIETRDRAGSRRGAMEYRITDAGRTHLKQAWG
jgi:hypothetical protein